MKIKNYFKQSFSFLQKVGKSLMLPVSVLPVAGILLAVGAASFSFIPVTVSQVMAKSGGAIFSNLPLLFAVSVALGFANNDGVAAVAALVGYAVMVASLAVMGAAIGVKTIDTGVFGGILVGAVAAFLFNRYYRIQLPSYLGFFSGKRFVPIVTSFVAIGLGVCLVVVWPPIGQAIDSFSHWAAHSNPRLAFPLYGVIERALIPFGLHHIWNVPFFFETGDYLDPATGQMVSGEIARYLAGDPTSGNLAGGYLFKMWGLPAAALAIWQAAPVQERTRIAGIMFAAALTSFLTGITEPIEFSFLFVAPVLYAFHALLAGLAFFVCIALEIKLGATFSHGLFDYLILFPKSTNGLWLWVIGPLWALMYYGIFYFTILKFNLKTPGRGDNTGVTVASVVTGSGDPLAQKILVALGGSQNIKNLDACITRLRVELHNMSAADISALKQLGAADVLVIGSGLQAIFGTNSENIKTEIEKLVLQPVAATNPPNILGETLWKSLGGIDNIADIQVVAETRIRIQVKNASRIRFAELQKTTGQRAVQVKSDVIHLIIGSDSVGTAERLKSIWSESAVLVGAPSTL